MKKVLLTVLFGFFHITLFAGEEIKLTLIDQDVVFKYTPSTSDWYFGAYDETGMYTVHLDYITDRTGQYGTYTDADLDKEYSYIRHSTDLESEDLGIGEGSEFTFEKDGGYYTLTGRLLCSDGNTYILDGRFEMPQAQTFNIEGQFITRLEYSDEDKDWYIRFKNDDYKITLDLMSPDGTFSGTYTEADAFAENSCFVTDMSEDEDIPFETFTVTMKQSEDVNSPNKGCEITGTGTTFDGNTYHFHMIKYPPIKPLKEVDIDVELTKAEWPSNNLGGDGSYYELTEKNNPHEKWQLACYRLTGEISEEEIDTTLTVRLNSTTGKILKLDNGKVTQTLDAETMNIIVKTELVMNDSVQYNFTFQHPVTINDHLSYTFTNLWVDTSLAQYGSINLNASDDNCSMSINITDAEVPGTYDERNAFVTLIVKDDDICINSLAIIKAECTLAEDDTPLLDCCFVGSDMNIHTIKASFVLPEITDTLNLEFADAYFDDETYDGNGFCLSYNTEDYDMGCYMTVLSGNHVEGHYTVDQLDNTSYILFTDAEGRQHNLRFFSGEFDVTNNENDVTLAGTFQAGNYYVTLIITTAETLPSAIDDIKISERKQDSSFRYNIFGQRVDSYYRGIYIQNGKKYLTYP